MDSDESDEGEEEEARLSAAVEGSERESEGEGGDILLALNPITNANNDNIANNDIIDFEVNNSQFLNVNHGNELANGRKGSFDKSFDALNKEPIINKIDLNDEGRCNVEVSGAAKEDCLNVDVGNSLGQEGESGGPAIFNHSHKNVNGGVNRRGSRSVEMGQSKPIIQRVSDHGGKVVSKGGVYSDGPRAVYHNLVNGPFKHNLAKKVHDNTILPSASLRKQQQMVQSLSSRHSKSFSSKSVDQVSNSVEVGVGRKVVTDVAGVSRKHPSSNKGNSNSESFVGDSICCSSINSSDIHNCNRLYLKKYEQEVASKVWKGALALGVELSSTGGHGSSEKGVKKAEKCVAEIKENEKRDEDERIRREHKQPVLL
jgi:hypothetical protein